MKLGQTVKFKRCLVKAHDAAAYGHLTEDQEKQLEDECQIKIKKVKDIELEDFKTGIIVGKRRIGIETTLEEAQSWDGDFLERFAWVDTEYDTVYLVACDLKGMYRVRETDVEVIE